MTREELHALVWSKPMRTAAKERGISDVALAKRCRNANVPVPPRGYWNKVHAGKRAVAQPLPPLPPTPAERAGLGGLFPALRPAPASDAPGRDGSPRPEFADIKEVTRRIEEAVGEVRVSPRLDRPHPIVAKLLAKDERRQAARPPGDHAYYDLLYPTLAAPIQQRRLRLLSALLLAFARLGASVHGGSGAGERFTLSLGRGSAEVLLAVENGPRDPFYRGRGSGRADGQRLRLDIVGRNAEQDRPVRSWRDGDLLLERQAADIVRGVLVHAEEAARASTLRWHDYDVAERARRAREAREAAERAEAAQVAREAAAAKARLQALADGADGLERADRIRRYVAAVKERAVARPDVDAALLERWSAWALAEADAADPVVSGRFEADLTAHGGGPCADG